MPTSFDPNTEPLVELFRTTVREPIQQLGRDAQLRNLELRVLEQTAAAHDVDHGYTVEQGYTRGWSRLAEPALSNPWLGHER
ncbi:hypothetical protein [Parenemella sanctibonifatiensis]|uniref:hypothetical protein n=1 Tax=Parenemella sanctibonifatiensis TaxID=2016505 RepID=UPI001E40FF87|nr:hypothetical protein [Parenemella sanctibonifatiensis]